MRTEYQLSNQTNQFYKFLSTIYALILFLQIIFLIIEILSGGAESYINYFARTLGVVLFLTLLWQALSCLYNERLFISDNGIEYYTFGLQISAPWNEVKELAFYGLPRGKKVGILVDTKYKKARWFWYLLNVQNKAIINLTNFSDNWHDSELGQQIKQYAPHLFEKEKSA